MLFCINVSFVLKLQCKPDKPVFLMSWEGKNPKLPSVLLNSHIDVVPVFPVSLPICLCCYSLRCTSAGVNWR